MKPEKFNVRPIIVSSDPSKWSSDSLKFIHRVWGQAEDCEVDPIMVVNLSSLKAKRPRVYISTRDNETHISPEWFAENITSRLIGYNLIILDITREERLAYGVVKFDGEYWPNKDNYMECWISVDKDAPPPSSNRTRTAYDPLLKMAVNITKAEHLIFHEAGHAFTHFSGRRQELAAKYGLKKGDLITHYFDYQLHDVTRVYREVSFRKWSLLDYMKSLLEQVVNLLTIKIDLESQLPLTPPKPPLADKKLEKWALAIQAFEDYVKPGERYRDGTMAPEGSLSYRNNNPGNLRWSPFQAGVRNNFSFFNTYQEGYNALIHQLRIAADGRSSVYRPDMTILEFFEKYAPSSDNNWPRVYAQYVADRIGVPIETKIKTLI